MYLIPIVKNLSLSQEVAIRKRQRRDYWEFHNSPPINNLFLFQYGFPFGKVGTRDREEQSPLATATLLSVSSLLKKGKTCHMRLLLDLIG